MYDTLAPIFSQLDVWVSFDWLDRPGVLPFGFGHHGHGIVHVIIMTTS
jgi:hypothetical protein